MPEPLEDVDYVVDYYAIIGVERDASADDIAAAIKRQRVLNHPDRYAQLADWAKKKAEAQARLLGRAAERVTDPMKRARQDELLGSGLPVSQTGMPIITPGRGSFTLRALAGEDIEGQLEADLERALQTYGGADPDYIAELEQRIASAPTPDPRLLERYRKALDRQENELVAAEVLLHMAVGSVSPDSRPATVAGYLGESSATIAAQRDRVAGQLADIAGMLEAGTRLALSAPDGTKETSLGREDVAARTAETVARFDRLADRIKETAEARASLMEKRLALIRPAYVGDDGGRRLILVVAGEDSRIVLPWRLRGTTAENDPTISARDLDHCTEPAVATRLRRRGISVATLTLDADLPWHDQVERVVTGHFEALLNSPPAPEQHAL